MNTLSKTNEKTTFEICIQMNDILRLSNLDNQEKLKIIREIFAANLELFKNQECLKLLMNKVQIFPTELTVHCYPYSGYFYEKNTPKEQMEWLVGYATDECRKYGGSPILLGSCSLSSKYIDEGMSQLKKQNVKNYHIDTYNMLGKNFQHEMNYVDFNGESYLVDATLSQFFNCFFLFDEMRQIVPKNCISVGSWFLSDDAKMKLAMQLVKYGYVPATDENIKNYFDCFVLANDPKRTSITDNKVEFSADDYKQKIFNTPVFGK